METGQVEFKETTGQLERGMETLCAFLNGTGGTVLFGVNDKGKIIGQEVCDKTKRDIARGHPTYRTVCLYRGFIYSHFRHKQKCHCTLCGGTTLYASVFL